jgi:hypothetical protein
MSTGPKSYEGRRRIGEANRARAQARHLAKVQAAAQAQALEEYEAAVALYQATCQQDISGFPGLKAAMMQIQAYKVERAAQRCRDCGADLRAGEENSATRV